MRRMRAYAPIFFFTMYMSDISFPGKTTLLNTIMTSELILEHSWMLKSAFLKARARSHIPQGQ